MFFSGGRNKYKDKSFGVMRRMPFATNVADYSHFKFVCPIAAGLKLVGDP